MALWIVLAALGAALIFCTHPSQKILAVRPWRAIGAGSLLVSVLAASSYLPVNGAFFAWLVIMVVAVGFLPSISAVLGPRQPT